MATKLTAGATAKMLSGEVSSEKQMMPILQVTGLKLIQQARRNHELIVERYKVSLSDGIQWQEGILNTTLNILVKQGNIQVGSVLRLTHFVCNTVRIRRIIVVMELDIIAERCNIIGNIVPAFTGKPNVSGQSSVDHTPQQQQQQRVGGFEQQQPRSELNDGTVRHGVVNSPQPQVGERLGFGASPSTRPFVSPNAGYGVFRQEQTRAPQAAYSRSPVQHQPPSMYANMGPVARNEAPPRIVPNVSGQSSINYTQQQRGAVSVNTQSVGGFEQQQARRNELNNGTLRHGVANSPQPQVGERQAFGALPSTRPFGSPNACYGSSGQEQTRAPQAAYSRPPVQHQPPSMYSNMDQCLGTIVPIAALNPYLDRWTIKVRVTSKGELRRFNSTRGDGKVFSFDLVDADGGEIRVTCFNDVVDKFFDLIVVGNVYLMSKGSLKPARKEYNHLPNDYERHLDNASTVQRCYEDDGRIPRNQFHFRNIGDTENMETNSITDLIGIVSSISTTGSIMRKNGTEAQKRALQVKDMSGRSVEVTMWGNFCNAEGQRLQSLCDSGVFPVLAVKAGRISEFNGKQVSTIGSSQLFIEPDFPEARELREWYEREGRNAPCISISREFSGARRQEDRKVVTQIKDEKLGTSEKADWITVSATISFIKLENFCYAACPIINGDRPCSKKVTNNGDGTWWCERCDRCVDECDYKYLLELLLQDHTGVTWATAFQEAGEEIMGMPAKDLYYVKHEDRDEEKFEDIIREAAFTRYIFKLKIKEETYNDEARVKATVVKAEKLGYSTDTRSLLEAINKVRTVELLSNVIL